MDEFMENFGGYIVIGLGVILIGLGVFTFLTSKNQNERIAYLEQTVNDMSEQIANAGAPSITMVQVQDEVKKMIEDALVANNDTLTEASAAKVEEAVKKAMEESKEKIYNEVYEQVISDITNNLIEVPEPEAEKEEEKEEEKKDDKAAKTPSKPKSPSKPKTTDTPAVTPSTPSTPSAPAPEPDDPHFKVDDGSETITR